MQGHIWTPQTDLTFRELKWPCYDIWKRVNYKSSPLGLGSLFTTQISKYPQYSAALSKCHKREKRERWDLLWLEVGQRQEAWCERGSLFVHWWGRESTTGEGSRLCQFVTQKVQQVRGTLRTRLMKAAWKQSLERWGPVRSWLSLSRVLNCLDFIGKIKGSWCRFEVKNQGYPSKEIIPSNEGKPHT